MSQRMARWNSFTVAMFLSSIVLAFQMPAQVVASQNSDLFYEFDSGQTLSWKENWELDHEFTSLDQGVESVTFVQSAALLTVVSLPNGFDLDEARDIYLGAFLDEASAFSTIDRSADDGISYSLDLLRLRELDFGSFSLFRAGSGNAPAFAFIFIAGATAFSAQFESAQDSFTLDGADLFDGIDGAGLQDQLVSGASDLTVASDAAAGDAPAATPDADGPGEDDPGGNLEGPRNEPLEDLVVQFNESFVSPQHGLQVTWGSSWERDPEVATPTVSDTSRDLDQVSLVSAAGDALLTVTFTDADSTEVPGLMEVWESPEFIATAGFSGNAAVVLAERRQDEGSMVLVDFLDDGTEIVVISEAYLAGDNSMVVVQLSTTTDHLPERLSDSQNDITIEREPVLQFFSIDEIVAAIESQLNSDCLRV